MGESPHHLPTGAVALGVDDPATMVPGFLTEGQVTFGIEIEIGSQIDQAFDGGGTTRR